MDWTLDLVLPTDIVQLKTERAPGVRREYFEPGQVVFREGDRGDRLYVVTEGEVEVLKETGAGAQPVRRLGRGDCFGEIALVREGPRTATVRAVSATNVLAVDREAFQALFATLPPLRGFFESLIEARR
jgi:CRP-like cAMP-binding protein